MAVRSFYFIVFIIICSSNTISNTSVPGQELRDKYTETWTCNPRINRPFQCDSEKCNVILTCAHENSKPVQIQKCHKKTPYCTVGRYYDYCSDRIESTSYACNDLNERTFSCTKPGYYPGMLNFTIVYDFQTLKEFFCF